MIYTSYSEKDTEKIAKEVVQNGNTNAYCLYGELGAGKTSFIRGSVNALGLKDLVQSPTYTFERVYSGQGRTIYHFDFYRLEKVDELYAHDLIEALEDKQGIVFIEWPEKINTDIIPVHHTEVFIKHMGVNTRRIYVKKSMTNLDAEDLIKEFHVPQHVERHCIAVAKLAVQIGRKLQKQGIAVNLELVRLSALLHDLVRVVDFRTFSPDTFPDPVTKKDIEVWKLLRKKYAGLHHAIAGASILEERGFSDVAKIVKHHRYAQIKDGFGSWEEKLVYYADKRAKHDEIVPLKERLNDGRTRNMPNVPRTKKSIEMEKKVFELEKEILLAAKMKAPEFD